MGQELAPYKSGSQHPVPIRTIDVYRWCSGGKKSSGWDVVSAYVCSLVGTW